ncbi:hypothetical protein HanRHA438_Chr13g0586141 [Helianthus annuus]|nr:hypothetical protein HanIR_Chr13g0626161 [Helianthus annuus]KAJ0857099.1 hypothetical protein HanRHA438_Chr13g0586141 [Helianthus annuus]
MDQKNNVHQSLILKQNNVDFLTLMWQCSLARELVFRRHSLILPSYAHFFETASSIWKPNQFSQSIS